MLERIEQTIAGWLITIWLRVMARLHPQLRDLKEPRRQRWAIWFSNMRASSCRQRVFSACLYVFVPLAVAAVCLFIAQGFNINLYHYGAAIAVAALPIGAMVGVSSRELLRRDDVRKRSFLALRICGADLCLRCGYNMSGHTLDLDAERTCPECGGAVEPLREWRKRQ